MAISHTVRSIATDSLTAAIVEKVADREGVEPTELRPPLYEVVNPDALESLFRPQENGRVEFAYCGYDVVVRSDGAVSVGND